MKYAHIADCHIGSWRDPLLADLSTTAFEKAIGKCIERNVDFILIAGDLFNTSLPGIDKLKLVTKKLKTLSDKEIPVYMIAGSHDFSPSGKTMLDVLENAGLITNVAKGEEVEKENETKLKLKFTIDKKTNTKITGLLGKKGGLERNYYEALERTSLESETGYKIFMFHTLLTELKPKSLENVPSEPLSLLPKNFNYYAGGHPHFVYSKKHENYGRIAYPGPLFPNSFKELEELKHGGFYIIDTEKAEPEWIPIITHDVDSISLDCEHKSAEQVESELKEKIKDLECKNKIITIRVKGTLESGKPSDINWRELFNQLKENGAYVVLKNAAALTSKEFEEIKIDLASSDELESNLINEQISESDLSKENAKDLAKQLLQTLDTSKEEDETVATFEKRLKDEVDKLVS